MFTSQLIGNFAFDAMLVILAAAGWRQYFIARRETDERDATWQAVVAELKRKRTASGFTTTGTLMLTIAMMLPAVAMIAALRSKIDPYMVVGIVFGASLISIALAIAGNKISKRERIHP